MSFRLGLIIIAVVMLMVGCAPAPATPAPTLRADATPSAPATVVATVAQGATAEPTLSPTLSPDVVATVNGAPIARTVYERQVHEAERFYAQQADVDPQSEAGQQGLQQVREQILQWMVDQALIEQAAASEGIVVPASEVEAAIAAMQGNDSAGFEQWLAANDLTLEQLRQELGSDLLAAAVRDRVTDAAPRTVPQVRARHILLSSKDQAEQAERKLLAGEAFRSIAQEMSQDHTTRASGGDLGFVPEGIMPAAFDEVAFALQAGETSPIVRSEFGYHIIQVIEIDPSRPISEDLWPVVQQQVFEDWLSSQRAQAEIHVSGLLARP